MSDELIRPGPPSIEPNSAPGGLVFHAYAVPSQRLLVVTGLGSADIEDMAEIGAQAERDSDAAFAALTEDEVGVCLVGYDGDSGERMVMGVKTR